MASPTQSSVTVDDALSRLQDVHNALGDVKGPLSQDTRLQALSAARNLVAALEKPEEVVMQYGFEVSPLSKINDLESVSKKTLTY